jgi:hypothetical protein
MTTSTHLEFSSTRRPLAPPVEAGATGGADLLPGDTVAPIDRIARRARALKMAQMFGGKQ